MERLPLFKIKKKYIFFTILIFVIEVFIALFVKDKFIRPFGGDVLVVILIYCFFKSFINRSPLRIAIPVLLFAYTVEILQYFKFVDYLELREYPAMVVILGSSFSWLDFLAYTAGFIIIILLERKNKGLNNK